MKIENTILQRVAKRGGKIQRRDLMRVLWRFPKKDREQAMAGLVDDGSLKKDEVITGKPGPSRVLFTLTAAGRKKIKQLVSDGLIAPIK